MNKTITTITAGAGIALAALLLPALGASAAVVPAQKYSWATGFDSGSAGPSWLQENFLIQNQSLKGHALALIAGIALSLWSGSGVTGAMAPCSKSIHASACSTCRGRR